MSADAEAGGVSARRRRWPDAGGWQRERHPHRPQLDSALCASRKLCLMRQIISIISHKSACTAELESHVNNAQINPHNKALNGLDAALFFFKCNIKRNQLETLPKRNWFSNKEKHAFSASPLSLPPSTFYLRRCLHLKIAQRKCSPSLTGGEQFALLSSYSGKKGRWCVSCECVGQKRNVCISLRRRIKSKPRDKKPVVKLNLIRMMCPSISESKLAA